MIRGNDDKVTRTHALTGPVAAYVVNTLDPLEAIRARLQELMETHRRCKVQLDVAQGQSSLEAELQGKLGQAKDYLDRFNRQVQCAQWDAAEYSLGQAESCFDAINTALYEAGYLEGEPC